MPNNSKEEKLKAFGDLLDVLDTLRARCPWDSKQTNESLRPNTIEETMELCEAILLKDYPTMRKELGDVLLHVLFYAVIANEQGHFDIADVCTSIVKKLKFRHPHIYGEIHVDNAKQVCENWEVLKLKEKGGNKSVLSGVPATLPSLIKAERVQEKASNVGFDWENRAQVWDKVKEEMSEVEQELMANNSINIEKEFGDLFFALVNAARLYGVRPDNALEKTNLKFIARFNHIEKRAHEKGVSVNEMTLEQMDELWDEAKALHLGEV